MFKQLYFSINVLVSLSTSVTLITDRILGPYACLDFLTVFLHITQFIKKLIVESVQIEVAIYLEPLTLLNKHECLFVLAIIF